MRKSVFLVFLFLLPSLVFAADFAKDSVFLSKTDISQSDNIFIHTVLSNTNNSMFTGTVTFLDGKNTLGSVPTSLAAYQAGTASILWKATTGSHTITVDLYDNNQLLVAETQASFFITSTSITPNIIESSQPIESAIQSVLPSVTQYVAPVFSAIDAARTSANTALTNASNWTQNQLQVKNKVNEVVPTIVGSSGKNSASSTSQSNIITNLWSISITVLLYFLTILRYIVTHIAVFYPVAAFLFFYILWRLFRGVRRR